VAFVWTNQTIYVFNALMGHWLPYRPTTDEKSSAGPILPFSDVRLSPNPCSSGLVQFSLPPSNSSWQVVVVDVTGRDVIKKEIPPSTGEAVVELSLSSGAGAPLSGGRYWVYLQSDNRREVRPLVVIR